MADEARKKEWRNKEYHEAIQASETTILQQEAQATPTFKVSFEQTILKFNIYRGVAQMVARLLWEQDAAGSTPVTPTT